MQTPDDAIAAQTKRHDDYALAEKHRAAARESLAWLVENDPTWAMNIAVDTVSVLSDGTGQKVIIEGLP